MKMLSINTGWQTQRLVISDDAKADTAYAALKDAINTYDRFSNDKGRAVTIIEDTGEASFKIEMLVSVAIEDLSEASDEVVLLCDERNRRLKRKIDAQVIGPEVVPHAAIKAGDDEA